MEYSNTFTTSLTPYYARIIHLLARNCLSHGRDGFTSCLLKRDGSSATEAATSATGIRRTWTIADIKSGIVSFIWCTLICYLLNSNECKFSLFMQMKDIIMQRVNCNYAKALYVSFKWEGLFSGVCWLKNSLTDQSQSWHYWLLPQNHARRLNYQQLLRDYHVPNMVKSPVSYFFSWFFISPTRLKPKLADRFPESVNQMTSV